MNCTNNIFEAVRGRSRPNRLRELFRRNKDKNSGGGQEQPTATTAGGVAFQAGSTATSKTADSEKTATVQLEIPGSSQKLDVDGVYECCLCCHPRSGAEIVSLILCNHYACRECLESYLRIEISESRIDIACPLCPQPIHPTDIQEILSERPEMFEKYENFMVRRVLLMEADSRWCPSPDCNYAVIAAGCASCPRIQCGIDSCRTEFCYHCKEKWHPDQTCDAARLARRRPSLKCPDGSINFSAQSSNTDEARSGSDIKPCPRCQVSNQLVVVT